MVAVTRMVAAHEAPEAGTWVFDAGHSRVAFEGRHLMVTKVRGQFEQFTGRLVVPAIPEESYAELTVDAASVASNFADRDNHLRSADFFDVEHFPTIIFRSTSLRHVEGDRWQAMGDLTIRKITHPVTLAITFAGGVVDPWGNEKIGFAATTTINREDWGLTWNMPLERGGLVVSKEIRLDIDVEAVRQ